MRYAVLRARAGLRCGARSPALPPSPSNAVTSIISMICASLRIVGFPLGFHDTLYHLPIVRQAAIASSFGVRFQGQGFFLTDARTHRGMSGAPVVMRAHEAGLAFPWKLLGVHSSRMEMSGRDVTLDEALSLNCAWYADVLMAVTAKAEAPSPAPAKVSSPA